MATKDIKCVCKRLAKTFLHKRSEGCAFNSDKNDLRIKNKRFSFFVHDKNVFGGMVLLLFDLKRFWLDSTNTVLIYLLL